MAYTFNGIALSTYGIKAGHAPGSNICMEGCFDMPERTGTTYREWDDSDSVEPWVLADEIMFAGRDIVFFGSIQGTVSGMNGYLSNFYSAINAATGLSILTTPYNSSSGYVESIEPKYMNGGCTVTMTFREPVVALTGTLPTSGVGNPNTIDSIPFSSFGLYISRKDALHNLPGLKHQYFTKYGEEGYQIVKRRNRTLELRGFVIGTSLSDFITKIEALYKVFSSAGTRTIVLDTTTTITCFATKGFGVEDVFIYNTGMLGRFNIDLIITNIVYS